MLNLAVLLEDHHRSRTPRATTPQHLVGTLRIGKGSLYNSFGGKRQLLDLALRRYLDLRITAATAALEGSGPAKERLRKALRLLRHRHPGATRYTQGVVRCRRRPRLPFGGWIVETGTNNSGGGHGGLRPGGRWPCAHPGIRRRRGRSRPVARGGPQRRGRSRTRATHEPRKTSTAPPCTAAWAMPTRRVPRSANAHSAHPVIAVGTAVMTPRPTSRRVARLDPARG